MLKLHAFNPAKLPGRGQGDDAAAANHPPPPSNGVMSCLPLPTLLAGYAVRSQLPAVDSGADARFLLLPCQKAYMLFALRSRAHSASVRCLRCAIVCQVRGLRGAHAVDGCHACSY